MNPKQVSNCINLQIAGGLSIYKLKHSNFRSLLIPSANTLLLTGDCLTVSQSSEKITSEFIDYLQTYWKHIIYIPGRTELRAPGAAVTLDVNSNVNYKYRTQYSIGSIYAIIGATYMTTIDRIWLTKEEQWVDEILKSEVRRVILASYYPLPKYIHDEQSSEGQIAALVHGTGPNQFCPTKPIVNHYRDYTGELRSDYNPEFVLELR